MELALAPTRSKAADWVRSGLVQVNGRIEDKPSFPVAWPLPHSIRISVTEDPLTRFVSRAGAKLEGALTTLKFNPQGLEVLDIGISTGGFAEVLLNQGAKSVVGVEVGHGQLHESLRGNERLTNLEGLNFKDTETIGKLFEIRPAGFDFLTADVSFISILKLVPNIKRCLKPDGHVLALIKPQFELGSNALDKKGIVKDTSLYAGLRETVCRGFESEGFRVIEYIQSSITGQDGNQEFFLFARKAGSDVET